MTSRAFNTQRSTDAPMDYEFTSRSSTDAKPVWAASNDDPSTPRKRNHDTLTAPLTPLRTPIFGAPNNVPFLFRDTPRQESPQSYPWAPPQNSEVMKTFPQPTFQPEVWDVDMADASPPKAMEPNPESGRVVATGALRRVYNARKKKAAPSSLSISRTRGQDDDDDDDDDRSLSSDEDDERTAMPVARNNNNHYTLNLPAPPAPRPNTPFMLLGYLQVFFNLSLILIFLYLIVQFILTVQRDVQDRISEYSMDIVQEIAMCALQYKNNNCEAPMPALVQQCGKWDTCMNRDPTIVGRAKVGAETIAEVLDGFVQPISWKALIFWLSSLVFLTTLINALPSLYRSRHASSAPHATDPPMPMTPVTPYPPHHFGGYLSPAPTPSWGRTWKGIDSEDLQTPTRRRRLEGGGSVKIK